MGNGCFDEEDVIPIDRATGQVTRVEVGGDDEDPLVVRSCVREGLRKAKFEVVGTGTQTISRMVTL